MYKIYKLWTCNATLTLKTEQIMALKSCKIREYHSGRCMMLQLSLQIFQQLRELLERSLRAPQRCQTSSDFQHNFLRSGPLQVQRSLRMLQQTVGRHDRSRFLTSTFSCLFRLKYAQISQNVSKYQNRKNMQNMDMNCDLDIRNRPNKGLKTVQNPSVSAALLSTSFNPQSGGPD